ncbi:MAG: hypothetical protein MZV63_12660 [Marinilabiliales bacterium]|nr:hypothetical protein [Marinilabiliales bacterium]
MSTRKGSEIVAGVCAIPAEYRVVNVPGVWGWMIMKVLPCNPFLQEAVQPGQIQVSGAGGNLLPQRVVKITLPDLFEAVCAEEGYHTALTWLDDHSELYETLRTNRQDGDAQQDAECKTRTGICLRSPEFSASETEKFYDISGLHFPDLTFHNHCKDKTLTSS